MYCFLADFLSFTCGLFYSAFPAVTTAHHISKVFTRQQVKVYAWKKWEMSQQLCVVLKDLCVQTEEGPAPNSQIHFRWIRSFFLRLNSNEQSCLFQEGQSRVYPAYFLQIRRWISKSFFADLEHLIGADCRSNCAVLSTIRLCCEPPWGWLFCFEVIHV